MQKDTRWNSERDALLFDPEGNELNGKKMNIFPKKRLTDLANFFLLITDLFGLNFTDYRFVGLNFTDYRFLCLNFTYY